MSTEFAVVVRTTLTGLLLVLLVLVWAEVSQSLSRRWVFYNRSEHLWFLGGLWVLYAVLLWVAALL